MLYFYLKEVKDMGDTNEKKQGQMSPAAAVATGIVIGASAAVAGSLLLKDDKNRKALKKVTEHVKSQVKGYVGDAQQKAKNKTEDIKATVDQSSKEVKNKARGSIDSAQEKLEDVKNDMSE
jgi:gas vesicle protein